MWKISWIFSDQDVNDFQSSNICYVLLKHVFFSEYMLIFIITMNIFPNFFRMSKKGFIHT